MSLFIPSNVLPTMHFSMCVSRYKWNWIKVEGKDLSKSTPMTFCLVAVFKVEIKELDLKLELD